MSNQKRNWLVRGLALVLAASICLGLLTVIGFAEGTQQVNLMRSPEDLSEVKPADAEDLYFWGQNNVKRIWVKTIEFHDTKAGAPQNVWDLSAKWGDQSVIGWYENNTLHIAADGKVTLNPESAWMFAYFTNLQTLNFNGAVDTSRVTSMHAMFFVCMKLQTLDVSGFDTSAVTGMDRMFAHCESLRALDLGSFVTDQVTDFSYMFFNDKNLQELNVSSFRTAKAEYMHSMFYNCAGLTTLDLSGFDTAHAMTMGNMFTGCNGLADLDFSTLSTASAVTVFDIPTK